jgi:hypothetical protein
VINYFYLFNEKENTMKKLLYICAICVFVFFASFKSAAAPKQMKDLGIIEVPTEDLLTYPVVHGLKVFAVYEKSGQTQLQIMGNNRIFLYANLEHPAPEMISKMETVGFSGYNVVMYYELKDNTKRFYSYRMTKKGLKVLGSTAPDKFTGYDIIQAQFDGRYAWIVFRPEEVDGAYPLTTRMIQYTNKLGGMKKLIAPKYNYDFATENQLILPNTKNKYKYDITITETEDELTGEKKISKFTVRILK